VTVDIDLPEDDINLAEDRLAEASEPAEDTSESGTGDADTGEPHEGHDHRSGTDGAKHGRRRGGRGRMALAVGITVVVAISGLCGWLEFRLYQAHRDHQQIERFLQAGRQAVVNLTTISFTEVDVDVQRILDSATGDFHDDFQKRAQPFIDLVKQTRSETKGNVTAAGLESRQGNRARILAAVSVDTAVGGVPEQQPRMWRMRVEVTQVGNDFKVSNVWFVP
jgi:Mce-associated membrane protein